MTAVAAPYEDLLAGEALLTESLVEQLHEDAVETLLLRRFHCFLGCGYCEAVALLLAVGYTQSDARFAVEALASEPLTLH